MNVRRRSQAENEQHDYPFPKEPDAIAVVTVTHHGLSAAVHVHKHVNGKQIPVSEETTDDGQFLTECKAKVEDELRNKGIEIEP